MSYSAEVLADSISPDGVRLTTLKVTFPRFILAEVNTHRMLSRNSASSRAIPTEKIIERVMAYPFVPETFNMRVKGMGVGSALIGEDAAVAEETWLTARDNAVGAAEQLLNLNCDKSRANRLLEPFMWHTAIISATEWANFFALRDHPAAQPEFQITARKMRFAMEESEPRQLDYGWWHLPMITDDELAELCALRNDDSQGDWGARAAHLTREKESDLKLISAGRLARVSFDTHDNFEPHEKSIERAQMLMGNGHFSPFEHVARPATMDDVGKQVADDPAYYRPEGEFFGNFRGWVQMRAEIPHEDNFALATVEA